MDILHSYDQIVHDREAAIKLHLGDVFLNRFISIPKLNGQCNSLAVSEGTSGTKGQLKKKISRQNSNIPADTMSPTSALSPIGEPRHKTSHGVQLRSSKLHPIRVGFAKQVEKYLLDNSIPTKPLFATEQTCKLYDELRHSIVKHLDTRKSSCNSANSEKKKRS